MENYSIKIEVLRGYATKAGYKATAVIHDRRIAFKRHFCEGCYASLVEHAKGQPWGDELIALLDQELSPEEKVATKDDYCTSLNKGWS